MKSTWFAVFLFGSSMVLTGCGGSDTEAPDTVDSETTIVVVADGAPTNPFLGNADADAEYMFANTARLPEDVLDKVWAVNEANNASNQSMFDEIMTDEDVPPAAAAMVREFSALTTREGWTAAGMHDNPFYTFHSVNLLPFLTLELADGDAFNALIGRVEATLEQPLERRDIDGAEVLWIALDEGFGVAIHHDSEAVNAALIPDDATMIARVAGQYDPPVPFTPADFGAFNQSLGFAAYGSGFLDWRRVLDEVLSEDGLLAGLDSDGQLASIRENAACVSEFQGLADQMPRAVMGYTRIDASAIDFMLRQEMSESLAADLAPIARAPVSIDRELGGLVNFGLAMDLIAAREFARSLVDGWIANPPQCEAFAAIASGAPSWKQTLARPIPPIITNLHGLFVELSSLEMEEMVPTGGGMLSLYMKNPQFLVGIAQTFAPAVAELALEPGGEPQPVPPGSIPQLDATGLEAWIAMGDSALGLAVGADNRDALTAAMENSEADDLLMAGRMDFSILTTALDMANSMVDDAEATEVLEIQRRSYEALAEAYEEASFKLRFGPAGVDILAESKLR